MKRYPFMLSYAEKASVFTHVNGRGEVVVGNRAYQTRKLPTGKFQLTRRYRIVPEVCHA
jgi:hypothetical protein